MSTSVGTRMHEPPRKTVLFKPFFFLVWTQNRSIDVRPIQTIMTFYDFCSGERRAWSKTELEALRNAFQNHRQLPKFGEIEELLALCPMLKSRTPAQMKTRAWALIQLSNN
jgi:site-specific recombinase XerD